MDGSLLEFHGPDSGDTHILCSFIIRRDWHDFGGIFSYSDNVNILICSKCKYFTCRLFVYSYYSLLIRFFQNTTINNKLVDIKADE